MFVLANATIATPDPQITGQLAVVIVNTLLIAEAAFASLCRSETG
jgi:hypothetical protein